MGRPSLILGAASKLVNLASLVPELGGLGAQSPTKSRSLLRFAQSRGSLSLARPSHNLGGFSKQPLPL